MPNIFSKHVLYKFASLVGVTAAINQLLTELINTTNSTLHVGIAVSCIV